MPLFVDACGAVTPVGLSGLATCAALRAGVSRIVEAIPLPPPDEPLKGARVKARRSLRLNPRSWLFNLAAKALSECVEGDHARSIALIVCRPEPFRQHPGMVEVGADEILATLQARTGLLFDERSRVIETGAAGLVEGMRTARDLLQRGAVERCVVGGFDSLLNSRDVDRLRRINRIHSSQNPQGVLPGEGAVFLALSTTGRGSSFVPMATISGFGTGTESNTVAGPKFALGDGMSRAVLAALADSGTPEREIEFVVSNHTGERYSGWEAMLSRARTYRTRRPSLPVSYPASGVGDIGVASSALTVLVAAVSIARGYAAGSKGMCELGSEGSLRGACVVEPPPLRPAFASPAQRRVR